MTAPPKEIKAWLGSINSKYLDESASSTPSPQERNSDDEIISIILMIELLQRGVLNATVVDTNAAFDKVIATAGKALLTPESSNASPIPIPLLAASCILCGKLLEQLTQQCQVKDDKNLKSAMDRCKQVQDERLQLIVQTLCNNNGNNNSKDRSSNNDTIQDFRLLALSYYWRAASFQSTLPPMWKRVWDTCAQYFPHLAIFPLQQLYQIAQSKNNSSRMMELAIHKCEAWLYTTTTTASSQNESITDFVQAVDNIDNSKLIKTFLEPFYDTKVLGSLPNGKQALHELEQTDQDTLHVHVLKLQALLVQEQTNIETLVQEETTKQINRSTKASTDIRQEVRTQLWKPLNDDANVEIKQAFDKVAKGMIKSGFTIDDKKVMQWAFITLSYCIQYRYYKMAQLLPKKKYWQQLHESIVNIWPHVVQTNWISQTNIPFQEEFYSTILTFIPMTVYQTRQYPTLSDTTLWSNTFIQSTQWVQYLQAQQAAKDKEQQEKDGTTVRHTYMSPQLQQAMAAQQACACLLHAAKIPINETKYISHNSILRQTPPGNCSDFGVHVMSCFIAWSGIFNSQPWETTSKPIPVKSCLKYIQLAQQTLSSKEALDQILLDLCQVTLQSKTSVNATMGKKCKERLESILQLITDKEKSDSDNDTSTCWKLLRAYCMNELAQLQSNTNNDWALQSLNDLQSVSINNNTTLGIWTNSETIQEAVNLQNCRARLLQAQRFRSNQQTNEALEMLHLAVQEAPTDATAAVQLGKTSWELSTTPDEQKKAHVLLLQAAKLDPTKALPFALLGLVYIEFGNEQRAKGCTMKALSIDPTNPIAGRCWLQLCLPTNSIDENLKVLQAAVDAENDSTSGWAWRKLARIKHDDREDLAVVALRQALRCQDIISTGNELSETLAELALLYRRLGKYTASIRAYTAADTANKESFLPFAVIFSWAQVELELGLFDEAAEKFHIALQHDSTSANTGYMVAVYGQGVALLSIAERDLQDGKAGVAFQHIQRAIQECDRYIQKQGGNQQYQCLLKLLGDLHSFGALLPPNVYDSAQHQLDFVSQGEQYYQSAVSSSSTIQESDGDEEKTKLVKAALVCDIGTNILLQAQIMTRMPKGMSQQQIQDTWNRAAQEFENSIYNYSPLYAPAWCGLGCALAASESSDPLLAQHAFCRAIQLDKVLAEAYANLGFLYTTFGTTTKTIKNANDSVMDALTQVADTPMMWMNRAFVLEQEASNLVFENSVSVASQKIQRACDAYRAALQVMKHSSSMLGLSVTCRISSSTHHVDNYYRRQLQESHSNMVQYLGSVQDGSDKVSETLLGVLNLESAITSLSRINKEGNIQNAKTSIANGLEQADAKAALHVESIQRCISGNTETTLEERTDANFSTPNFEDNVACQIMMEPDNAFYWVKMAKNFISNDSSINSIQDAKTAIDRACFIWNQELHQAPKLSSMARKEIQADNFSEALTLSFWLYELLPKVGTKTQKEGESKEMVGQRDNIVENDSQRELFGTVYDLQRALLMDPGNMIAREALKQVDTM